MQAYRIITRVSGNGTIEVSDNPDLFGKEVEVIILPRQKEESGKMTARQFIHRWGGALQEKKIENDDRYRHLSEKYQ